MNVLEKRINVPYRWKKLGLIFKYTSELIGTRSHCQHPCSLHLRGDIFRIFFGSRDPDNNTTIFYFDFDIVTLNVIAMSLNPTLKPGEMGYFDANGIYPSCVIKKDLEYFMYTLGFVRGESPFYYTRIGLATSQDGQNYTKFSTVPLLNPSEYDPWMVTGPFVMFEEDRYRMWYVSGYKWDKNEKGELHSYYNIKYAESKDAINWRREGLVSINHFYPDETNIARPWILKEDGIYKAWFSYACGKRQSYRIGYAESRDGGYTFERMDHLVGITTSDEPWENEAIAYPAVIVHKGKKYMFYNGNKFGKDGIALAVEE